MNSIVSISFAVLFLVKGLTPAMDICCELKKLPNLFEHYYEHNLTKEESFALFVFNHYINDEGHDGNHDEKEHEQLPFHGSHQSCHPSAFYVTAQYFSLVPCEFPAQYSPDYYQAIFSSQFPEAPFQPPKALV